MNTHSLSIHYRYEVCPADIETVSLMVAATGVFNEAEEAIAIELIEERMKKGDKSDYFFVFAEIDGRVAGYTCYAPIPGTDKRYEVYWIAVDPPLQKHGIGKLVMAETEVQIQRAGGKRIYVETSSKSIYLPTRRFYEGNGYTLAAELENYHEEGDNLVVYVKVLGR